MENQTFVDLRAQYPLSPRKFWKKILEKLSVMFIVVIFVFLFALIYFISVSAVTGNFNGLFAGGFIAVSLVIIIPAVLYSWYVQVYIKRYYFSANDSFITIKKGVFAPTEIHVQYQKIQDVYVDQDILDRILGIYDVHLASATVQSGIEAHIDGVNNENADALKNFLLNKIILQPNIPNSTIISKAVGQSTVPT
ncbi:MAG: PH domain-containing protein [Ignavibacteriaceae bacterium]|jgi:putative membrane protein